MIENTCLGNNDFLEFLITEGLFLITLFCTNLHNLTIIADFLIFIHPHEHKVKTINYILTTAVKCWHFVFKKKKSSKICFLKPRKCGKRPFCQWKPSAAESSRCGFLPRQQTSLKEKLLPTQILFAFTPKNKLCAWRRHPKGWEQLQKGNSSVRATVNWFSLSHQQASLPENNTLPSPGVPGGPQSHLLGYKPSFFSKSTSQGTFGQTKGNKITPGKESTQPFTGILGASEVQV